MNTTCVCCGQPIVFKAGDIVQYKKPADLNNPSGYIVLDMGTADILKTHYKIGSSENVCIIGLNTGMLYTAPPIFLTRYKFKGE